MSLIFLASEFAIEAPGLAGEGYIQWLTNSVLVAFLVASIVIVFARRATKHMALVPTGAQNVFEAVVEGLYGFIEEITGKTVAKRAFSFLATLFIFILAANWFDLLPGVGTIGWGEKTPHGFHLSTPLLRPATADVNMTLAMAIIFMVLWWYWTMKEVGLRGFIKHTFGVQGGAKGFMFIFLSVIFFLVGVIDVISIMFRPVSLSLRLFGNILAGETLLAEMIGIGNTLGLPSWVSALMSVTVPLPFYFLELLVGVLQAVVFMLLCAVYLQLSTSHGEEEH